MVREHTSKHLLMVEIHHLPGGDLLVASLPRAKSSLSERADSATEEGNTGSELSREGGTEKG